VSHRPRSRASRRTLLALIAVGVVLVGGALVAYPTLRTRQMVRQLAGDEHEAATSRETLVAQLGPGAAAFFSRLLDHSDPGVRLQATEALLELQGPESLPRLAPLMGDYHARVRQRLVEEAAQWQVPAADELVLVAAADPDQWVRQAGVIGLAQRARGRRDPSPAALAALARAVDDGDGVVAGVAMSTMRFLAGRDFGYRINAPPERRRVAIARWRTWWARKHLQPPPALPPPTRITRSAPAPDFSLEDVAGHRWQLRGLAGRPLLLHFFGTWCGPCQHEMPDLDALHHERPDLVILALGIGEQGPDALRRYARDHGLTFPLAIAPGTVADAYGDIREVPVTFLIDGQGRLRRRYDGTRDLETFRAAVRDIAPV
jgi:peroxiredoxin